MTFSVVKTPGTTYTFNSVLLTGVVGMSGFQSGKVKKIPITTTASTAHESTAGLRDNGEFTLDMIRSQDDSGQAALEASIAAQATHTMIIVAPSGTLKTYTFQAYVTSLPADFPSDDKVSGKCSFQITGAVTIS